MEEIESGTIGHYGSTCAANLVNPRQIQRAKKRFEKERYNQLIQIGKEAQLKHFDIEDYKKWELAVGEELLNNLEDFKKAKLFTYVCYIEKYNKSIT